MVAPTLSELIELADLGCGFIAGEGQVTALWERRLGPAGEQVELTVSVTCVHAGRAARVVAERVDADGLRRATKAAGLRASQARAWPSGGLPEAAEGPAAHQRFDPELASVKPSALAARLGEPSAWSACASRVAISSTRGVRSAEQRSHVDVAGYASLGPSPAAAPEPAGTAYAGGAAVLGPRAVAALLDRLRPAFGVDLALGHGPLAGRVGERIAAAGVELSDHALHPRTLSRSFDAEGVAREPVTLLRDGALVGGARDTASPGGSTGHATQAATLAPMPDHLVLEGGAAGDVGELLAPLDRPTYLPTLDGVEVDALVVLASIDALTREQYLVALRGHTPGGGGAALVPAIRVLAGIRARA